MSGKRVAVRWTRFLALGSLAAGLVVDGVVPGCVESGELGDWPAWPPRGVVLPGEVVPGVELWPAVPCPPAVPEPPEGAVCARVQPAQSNMTASNVNFIFM